MELQGLVVDLKLKVEKISKAGGNKAIERHKNKGKLLARERINYLLDMNSPFFEFSQLAGYKMYENDEVPAGGILTGIGRVAG